MKLCIIGNSHIASLRMAWDQTVSRDYNHIQPVFFGSRGQMLADLHVDQGHLKPRTRDLQDGFVFTSGGLSGIDPDHYNAFLVYGALTNLQKAFVLEKQFLSKAVKDAALHGYWQDRLNYVITQRLRRITDKPVFSGLQPLAAEKCDPLLPQDAYANLFQWAAQTYYAPLDVTLVDQPVQTMAPGGCSAKKYSTGSYKIQTSANRPLEQQTEEDFVHMNAAYGDIWLRRFFDDFLTAG